MSLLGVARPADQETIAPEKIVKLTVPKRRGRAMLQGTTWGSTRSDKRLRERGQHRQELFLGLLQEATGESELIWIISADSVT